METIAFDLQQTKRTPLLPEHVQALRKIGVEAHYAAQQIVAQAGQAMDRFIYIEEGEIEVVNPRTGLRNFAQALGPSQFVGEVAFLNGGSYSLAMRAAQPTRTIEVPRVAMLALMASVPEMSDLIIGVFAARRRHQLEENVSSLQLIGMEQSKDIRRIAEFASRNRVAFQSIELGSPLALEIAQLCGVQHDQPTVVFGRDTVITEPSPQKVAELLGMSLEIDFQEVMDVLIVGGGPAGVAAAVYAGAEGLSALVIEDVAIGGQAGTSSRIENYMGFPTGISGADLLWRGEMQAMKFGTRFAMPHRITQLERRADGLFCAQIGSHPSSHPNRTSLHREICAKSIVVATGVQYQRLPLARLEEFEGAGIYYAATDMEARVCRSSAAIVVGGGNSAGQAAMFLSRFAQHVHVLVRGSSLASSMSDYLLNRLQTDPTITIHLNTAVQELHGQDRLQAVTIHDTQTNNIKAKINCSGLFLMVGAQPNTAWLSGLVQLDERGFVKTGADAGADSPYSTSVPGIFAVGDVRAGSVKRVASAVGEGSVVISKVWEFVQNSHA